MSLPGQTGFKPKFHVTVSYDKWYLERLWHDRVYEPGECVKGNRSFFGWDTDDFKAALIWFVEDMKSHGMAVENVKMESWQPWITR